MENCLVTKLKGVVNNDSLIRFGEVKLEIRHAKTDDTMILHVGIPASKRNDLSVRAVGGTITELETLPASNFKLYQVGTGVFDVYVSSKYDITGLSCYKNAQGNPYDVTVNDLIYVSVEELQYCTNINSLNRVYAYGDVSKLSGLAFITIDITAPIMPAQTVGLFKTLKGNINSINKTNLKNLLFQNSAFDLTGNISYFADAALNSLKLINTPVKQGIGVEGNIASMATVLTFIGDVNFGNTKVTGNVEDMLKGMYVNGRRSGSFYFGGEGYAYLNGQLMTQGWNTCTFSDSGVTITKRADSSLVATYTAANDSWTYA
jgi:hypothetical protein